jgi:uncharacterized protein
MNDVYKFKCGNSPASIKDVDGKKGIVTGYFSHFDSVDSDQDVIRKGAFTKTISENGPQSNKPRIKHLLNHNSSQPLGKLIELKEDNYGLYYESQIGSHALGTDFIKMIESGLITDHSIGFRTIKRNQLREYNNARQNEAIWELTEVKLWEGSSLTAWGANPNTPITGMKSEDKAKMASNRIELLTKALKDGTFTDETFELIEIELKQLQQLFISLTEKTTEPEQATQPEHKDDELLSALKQYANNLKNGTSGTERTNPNP